MRDREGGPVEPQGVCVAREERSWGNKFGGDWGRRDFEEFVVAKVEQPA